MDIQYLLWLQEIRNATGGIFDEIFNGLSKLAAVCAVLIALTGFSRNFLGVHTPQDVVVGFVEGAILIFIVGLAKRMQLKSQYRINLCVTLV